MDDPTEDTITLYIRDIHMIPTLSAKEERILITRAKNNEREAFEQVILSNLKFVVKVASLYRGRGQPFADIISEGNVGLMEALRNFKLKHRVRFLTYAVFWVKQKIQKSLSEQARLVRYPISKISESSKVKRKEFEMYRSKGCEPSIKEIADALDMNEKRVRIALESAEKDYSLDMEISGLQNVTLGNTIGRKDRNAASMEVKDVLGRLSDKKRKIINLYFGLKDGRPYTLEEIGKEFNISRERVRQLKDDAIKVLRKSWGVYR